MLSDCSRFIAVCRPRVRNDCNWPVAPIIWPGANGQIGDQPSPNPAPLQQSPLCHRHTPERFEGFESAVKHIPEILECLLITGQSADYQLKAVVRDMDAYQDLLLNRITRIPGVTGVHSSFVLRRVVDKTAVPVAEG